MNIKTLIAVAATMLLASCVPDATEQPIDPPGELMEGSLTRDLDPEIDDLLFSRFTADNRDFAFALARAIRAQEPQNFFYSPHSVSLALAMLYVGAREGTKSHMANALRFGLEDDDLHRAFNHLDLMLASRADANIMGGEPPILEIYNNIWGNPDRYHQDFLDTLSLHYGAGIQCLDFSSDPEGGRMAINAWIAEVTRGRITDLIPPGIVTRATELILTNAIYFLAEWLSPFSPSQTQNRTFTHHDSTRVQVPMMNQAFKTNAYLGEETIAVSIPYMGRSLSMIAMMPADGADYDRWEESLDQEVFDSVIDGLHSADVDLYFPKFEINLGVGLTDSLSSLGMGRAFDENAEFYGILGGPDDPRILYVGDVIHEAFIAVDEGGTEAAAATAVVVDVYENSSEYVPIDVEIHFNRPFYYMIYDNPTGTILFMGALDDPS